MGQPARDDEELPQAPTRPNLRLIQGGGEGDGVPTGSLSEADDRNALNAREQNPDPETPTDNPFNYPGAEDDNQEGGGANPRRTGRGRLTRWGIGIGAGGLSIFGLFGLSLPFKLPSILSMITGEATQRVEHIIENRAKRIVVRTILNKMGVAPNGNVVKSGSLLGSLAKTAAATKYEKLLAEKGLRFERSGSGVKLILSNPDSEDAKRILGKVFKNEDEILKALNGVSLTNKMLKTLVKEDLGIWRWFIRGKVSTWMRSYLGVSRFGTDKPTETEPDKKIATQAAEDLTEEAGRKVKALDGLLQAGTTAATGGEPSPSTTTVDAMKTNGESVRTLYNDAAATLKGASAEAITKTVTTIGQKIGSQFLLKNATSIGSKAIPFYGEIVMAALANVLIHWALINTANGKAAMLLGGIGGVMMGSVYAKWVGLMSQQQLGELDPDLVGYYSSFLDNIETSSIYNCIQTSWQKGCNDVGEPIEYRLNEQNPDWTKSITNLFATSGPLSIEQLTNLMKIDPSYLLSRLIVAIDSWLVEWVIKIFTFQFKAQTWFLELFMPGARDLADQKIEEYLRSTMVIFSELALKMAGLSIDALAGGAKLLNVLMAGSIFSMNRYLQSLALHPLSFEEASAQTGRLQEERRQDIKDKGVFYAMFSPEVSSSLTSRLVMSTPTSGGPLNATANGISSLASLVKNAPRALASVFSDKAAAAGDTTSPEELLNGVPFGVTDAELESELSANLASGEPCPSTDPNILGIAPTEFNNCKLDTAVAQNMLCMEDLEKAESAECNPDEASNPTNTAGNTTSPVPTPTATGSAIELAKQIVANPNITFSNKYTSQIQNYADGNTSCYLDESILRMLATMGQTYKIYISSLNRFCTNTLPSTTSLHFINGGGRAVDITMLNNVAATGCRNEDIAFINAALKTFPVGSRIQVGQRQCRSPGAIIAPAGITVNEVTDTTDHIHIGKYIK